jgi:hypothetical protein
MAQPASVSDGAETILIAEDDGAVRRLATIALRTGSAQSERSCAQHQNP